MKRLTFTALLLSFGLDAAPADLQQHVSDLWQQQDFAAAKEFLADKVNRKTKDAWLLAALGRSELELGQVENAEELLARAIKIEADNARYQFWFGRASCDSAQQASMFSALGYAKRCRKAFEQAVALAPADTGYLNALGKFYAQAPGIAGGDKEQALAIAARLEQQNPLQGQLLKLEILFSEEDKTAAEQFIANSELLQNRPEPYFMRGIQLAQSRDYPAAMAEFLKASKQDASDEEGQRNRLLALYQLGRASVLGKTDYQQGVNALTEFLADGSMTDFNEWAQFRLSQLYLALEQQQKAEELLTPLLATTRDDKLKSEIKKIL
ncbi:tetratricopeptide repeat protein [Arsukibacterium indicum]|uniref:Tetratricopeptide repeat protein n=1 Tax=Arsukibacterium indicum TaxID=2848612 RepID=A0ABS6MJ63_9GAMM|nr:tetratricopeptide repeat protein [Arsukibacterium indicum]MBV2128853.1 tetratricopeptide repeat protein [Arsukibacterium indicum]